MNDYQRAIKSIRDAKAAGRLPELKRKDLEMSGVGYDFLWLALANNPSRYTKSWAVLNRRMPPKPPVLIRGGDFDLRDNKPVHVFTTVKPVCKECCKEVKAVGISGRCVACAPESFEIGRRVQEEVLNEA